MSLSVAIRHRLGALRLEVAFEAPPGVTALFGRSGAGKTSVVNAIAGLLHPDEGRILADGAVLFDSAAGIDLAVHRRRVGYVFQEGRLFPHLTVRGNLEFGRRFAPRDAGGAEAGRLIELLGIGHLLDRRPGSLSGGEAQRVAIGRALLARPRILLLDEPLAALDGQRKAEILPYLERLCAELAMPVVYVSHALPEIARLATTVVALEAGRVVRAGPAAEVLSDVAAFPLMGRQEAGAILEGRIAGHDPADGLTAIAVRAGRLFVPLVDAPVGATMRIRVRARDVMLATEVPAGISALNILPVRVLEIAGEGAIVEIALECGGERLVARITRRSARRLDLAPGRPCVAILKAIATGRQDLMARHGTEDSADW